MNTQRILWIILVAAVIWSSIMAWEASKYKKNCSSSQNISLEQCRYTSPIAALELANNQQEFKNVIDQGDPTIELWNAEIARVNTCMDFLFIVQYWLVFFLVAKLLGKWPLIFVALFITLAAVFDIAENVRLLQALHGVTSHTLDFPIPRVVSEAKWIFFAVALLALGASLLWRKKIWPTVIGVLMLVSSGAMVPGIFRLPLLFWAIVSLFLAFLIALVYYFPFRPFCWSKLLAWIEFAYLVRFQLIAAFVLAIGLPAGYFLFPSVFIGLFDALGLRSFIFVTAALLHLAFTIMITIRLVLVYGPVRFPGIASLRGNPSPPWSTTVLFAGLAAPCVAMTFCGTTGLLWWQKLLGIVIAVGMALGLLWSMALLHSKIEPGTGDTTRTVYPPFRFLQNRRVTPRSRLGQQTDRYMRSLLPGEVHPGLIAPDGHVHSGHQLGATVLIISIVLYSVIGLYFSPNPSIAAPAPEVAMESAGPATVTSAAQWLVGRGSELPPAALFYALCLLSILTWLFSGVAFVFDRVRLPVLTTAIGLSFLFGMKSTDHHFDVKSSSVSRIPSAAETVRAWEKARGQNDPQKPIVVVATAGGGIRAAAWTTQVLTGLADKCKTPNDRDNYFSSSLLLVSSVSGGSVGNMYLVGSYDRSGELHRDLLPAIRTDSAKTSLSAVGWGMLYPDFVRTLPIVGTALAAYGFGQDVDRGWALETQWLANWDQHPWKLAPTMREWTEDVSKGLRPAAIFNATAVESGQRFVIASTTLPEDHQSLIQFSTDDSQYDVAVSTAARLSATFPWVSPVSRAVLEKTRHNNSLVFGPHVADGGYYDNSGILSASQWLLEAAGAIQQHPVVFLIIDSTPPPPAAGEAWSWQRQSLGPIETLLSVRDSSQQARADYELRLTLRQLDEAHLSVHTAHILYPADPLEPLSWHLTSEQQKKIREAWTKLTDGSYNDLQSALATLGCQQ